MAALLLLPAVVGAQNLRNSAFTIQYSDEGIVSLRHTNDVADTEYIANGGSLGPVVARYRTSPQGDWRDISHLKLAGEPTGNKIQYRVGDLLKTLAAQSEVSASAAVPGLATVNDGAVAPNWRTARGGRGGPPVTAATFPGRRRWWRAVDPIRFPADRNGFRSRRLLGRRRRESGPRPGAGRPGAGYSPGAAFLAHPLQGRRQRMASRSGHNALRQ